MMMIMMAIRIVTNLTITKIILTAIAITTETTTVITVVLLVQQMIISFEKHQFLLITITKNYEKSCHTFSELNKRTKDLSHN